jgi:hypothetical protein
MHQMNNNTSDGALTIWAACIEVAKGVDLKATYKVEKSKS